MTLADAIGFFNGATKDLKEATLKLTEAQADNTALVAKVANLEAKIAEAPSKESHEKISADLVIEKARADKAELDLKAEIEAQPERINAKAAELIAANGHAPVDTAQKNEVEPEQKKAAELTGLAKTRAAFASQISK